MKKCLLLGIMLILCFTCTGCVKYAYNIEINSKDKLSLTQTEAFNSKLLTSLSPEIEKQWSSEYESFAREYKDKGYEVKEYQDENYRGATLIKKDIKLQDLTKHLPKGFQNASEETITVEKGFIKTNYKLYLVYNLQDANNKNSTFQTNHSDTNTSSTNNSGYKIVSKQKITDPSTGNVTEITEYDNGSTSEVIYNPKEIESVPGAKPEVSLTIKTPKKATKHNATKVLDNNTYYWDLFSEQPVEISLEYTKYDFSAVGIVGSLIIILTLLVFIYNKSKNDVGF